MRKIVYVDTDNVSADFGAERSPDWPAVMKYLLPTGVAVDG